MAAPNAINSSSLAALAAAKQAQAPQAGQEEKLPVSQQGQQQAVQATKQEPLEQVVLQPRETAPAFKGKVFFGEFGIYANFLTPTGTVLSFYKGFAVVDNPELIEFARTLKDVKDVTSEVTVADLPTPPVRTRARNWAAGAGDPTIFNPMDLLRQAVASTKSVTQAAHSNSK